MSMMAIIGSIELGLIYGIMALGIFLSFRTLNTPDLTVDGSFTHGMSIAAIICTYNGNPFIAILAAFFGGCLAGCVTALLNTKLKIQPLLAGILVMLGLYSVNIRVMGNKPNLFLNNSPSIYRFFHFAEGTFLDKYMKLIISLVSLLFILFMLFAFLKTKLGFALRATGDNEFMVRASGINTDDMKLIGLALSNGLVAVSGALIGQYQSFSDVNMGVGMVVIGLASVIIGEVIFGTRSLLRRLFAVALGSILYRAIIAFAYSRGMGTNDLKLVSAIIVTLALSTGVINTKFIRLKKRLAKTVPVDGGDTNA